MATAQIARNLTVTAIALHRWDLAQGGYPADLAILKGGLGVEPGLDIDASPLRYRRTAEGFLLYSVGMDARDDGGSSATENREFRSIPGEPQSIFSGADWVWPARATPDEVRNYHDLILARITPPERSPRNRPVPVQSEFSTLIQVLVSELELTPVREGTNSAE
jgi:hypothetical protein